MPDAPSSPRKAVSSVSQQARSQKKPGAPKPKGAVRAKSGCYTCRIRRKKCDEQPNEEGACQTCVRLRLQCLGFGAKRPDWMRENNSVTELREKIKTFLASQGMIKGHSGSGPRTTEEHPPVLVLVDHLHTSPSSPPTPTLSATSSEGHRPPHNGMNTSFERAPPPYAAMAPPDQQPYGGQNWQPPMELGPHDPSMHRLPTVNDMLYHPSAPAPQTQPQPPPTMIQSPTSIVSAQSSWPPSHVGYGSYSSASTSISTALSTISSTYAHSASTLDSTYNHPISSISRSYNLDMNNFSDDEPDPALASPDGLTMPMVMSGYGTGVPRSEAELIQHYLHNVLPIQYLLADPSIQKFMFNLIQTSPSARDAACLLSALHLHFMHFPAQDGAVNAIFRRIEGTLLPTSAPRRAAYNEGDAMAGLHIVSSFLFSGGRGRWGAWLDIASQYVQNILNDPACYGPDHALRRCSESTRFIIKTTMWFDVLASVTTQQVPRFLETYRLLFGGAYIEDPMHSASALGLGGLGPDDSTEGGGGGVGGGGGLNGGSSGGGGSSSSEDAMSMLPVMGCENKIVLAIAEISNLAHWKASHLRRGCLSMPALVRRGQAIEESLGPTTPLNAVVQLQPGMFGPPALQSHLAHLNGHHHGHGMHNGMGNHHHHHHHPHGGHHQQNGGPTSPEAEVLQRRRLTNNIFRASAKVYLHTVLSGDYPACPEILAAVSETIDALREVPDAPRSVHRGVVRSVVFGICLSGCLTDDVRQRAFLLNMLERQQQEGVGNIAEVSRLMQQVWARRDRERERGGCTPVDWREVMRETHQDLLLLV